MVFVCFVDYMVQAMKLPASCHTSVCVWGGGGGEYSPLKSEMNSIPKAAVTATLLASSVIELPFLSFCILLRDFAITSPHPHPR